MPNRYRSADFPYQSQVSLEVLAKTFDISSESVVITNKMLDKPGPKIVHVNAAFTRLTGYSFEEAIGQTPRFLQGPETDREVLGKLRLKLSNNQLFIGKTINYRKDGSKFINEWRIQPFMKKNSQFNYYLAIQKDVTEREHTYQALTITEAKLLQCKMSLKKRYCLM